MSHAITICNVRCPLLCFSDCKSAHMCFVSLLINLLSDALPLSYLNARDSAVLSYRIRLCLADMVNTHQLPSLRHPIQLPSLRRPTSNRFGAKSIRRRYQPPSLRHKLSSCDPLPSPHSPMSSLQISVRSLRRTLSSLWARPPSLRTHPPSLQNPVPLVRQTLPSLQARPPSRYIPPPQRLTPLKPDVRQMLRNKFIIFVHTLLLKSQTAPFSMLLSWTDTFFSDFASSLLSDKLFLLSIKYYINYTEFLSF